MKSNVINTLVICGGDNSAAHEVPHLVNHVTSELINVGRSVTVLSKSTCLQNELAEGVRYEVGDFAQKELIGRLLDTHKEAIFMSYTASSNNLDENPLTELWQNLPPAVQLFSAAAHRGVKLVLISSGGMIYGEAEALPIRETHPTKPISPYGVTRLTLENYANLYAATHGLKLICVRSANVYGPGQRPFCGQGVIATMLVSAIRGIPLKVFGEHGAIRDYIYVSDIASGIVSALTQGHLSETYNLGSSIGLSNLDVIEVIKLLMQRIGREVQVETLPERALDVKANVLDSNKLQVHTGWKQKIGFNEGMRLTCEWLRANEI